jgi:Conjugal transfer protein TrbH
MMRSLIISTFCMLVLGACTTTADVGNLLPSTPTSFQQKLGHDAAAQVSNILPPASTFLYLQQPHTDEFGIAFVSALRAQGFAIEEHDSQRVSHNTTVDRGLYGANQKHSLKYVIDENGEPNGILISISVGARTIARPYTALNGHLKPAGYWVYKE